MNKALLARAVNRFVERAKPTTSDADILHRRWLLVDFDPVRPAQISSTELEHSAALALAREAREWLAELGMPLTSMVLADSGNGAHLLVRIELPNVAESTEVCKRCLAALDLRLSSDVVHVDTTNCNAARIWKLYGTVARKGDPTHDRPHRRARLLDVPGRVEVAARELLERLAGLAPPASNPDRRAPRTGGRFLDVAAWLLDHRIEVAFEAPWNGGRKWILAECPFAAEDHGRDRAAFVVQFASGAISAGCQHQRCMWTWQDLRGRYEPESLRRERPAGDPQNAAAAIDRHQDPWAQAQTATELLTEPDTAVGSLDAHGVLVPGSITELFSPRGLGKTHIAWALAVALACDGKRVLYIDRDNSRREVKRRLRAWGGGGCHTLKTLTREKAPALTDTTAWAAFPNVDYDVVIVDSFDAAAEGVGEQDSSKPSRAIAALLDVARATNGPAVLILGNVIKSGAHSRGSGVIEDRADIVFEVRDATDVKPTGSKPWWEELPPAGADAWAQRATRRKKRDRYRLALVPSKYRVGEEPDPLALEIDLSAEPWQLRNVADELIEMGEASRREAAEAGDKRLDAVADALRQAVKDGGALLMNDEAIPLLVTGHGLKRAEARALVQRHAGALWLLDPPIGRRGKPVRIVSVDHDTQGDSAGMQGTETPRQTRPSEGSIPTEQAQCGRQESNFGEPAPNAVFRNDAFLPPQPTIHPDKWDEEHF